MESPVTAPPTSGPETPVAGQPAQQESSHPSTPATPHPEGSGARVTPPVHVVSADTRPGLEIGSSLACTALPSRPPLIPRAPISGRGFGRRGRPPLRGRGGRASRSPSPSNSTPSEAGRMSADELRDLLGPGVELDDSNWEEADAEHPNVRETETTITVHGQEWQKNSKCTIDQRAIKGAYKYAPKFKLHGYLEKTEFEFFQAMFPMDLVDGVCEEMSTHISKTTVTKGEFWHFMGYIMYILVHPEEGSIDSYWLTKRPDGEMGAVHNLGKYGMSKSRFIALRTAFRLPTYGDA